MGRITKGRLSMTSKLFRAALTAGLLLGASATAPWPPTPPKPPKLDPRRRQGAERRPDGEQQEGLSRRAGRDRRGQGGRRPHAL